MAKKPTTAGKRSQAKDAVAEPLDPKIEKQVTSTSDFLPYLLIQVVNMMNIRFKEDLRKKDMSLAHWRVLLIVRRSGSMSLTEISQQTLIDQPTLSRIVNQMVERDLVIRAQRESDGRFLSISLSEFGNRRFEELAPIAFRNEEELLQGFSGAEVKQLREYMRRMIGEFAER